MDTGIRITICTLLAALALTMVAFTFASFTEPQSTLADAIDTSGEDQYILGEWDGKIAIFRDGNMRNPVKITGIELKNLREADRALIREGLIAASETELLELLEDLGS